MEFFDGLDSEVPEAAVEANRPSVEEALIAEESERKAFVDNKKDLGTPAALRKRVQGQLDGGFYGWP